VSPLGELVEVVRRCAPGALVHTDAVQAPAWFDLAPLVAGADLVSLSAHKIGGPKGIGALVVGARARPLLAARQLGGGQEIELRPGTQNVAGAAGFAAAVRELHTERDAEVANVRVLAERLIDGLVGTVDDLVVTVDRTTTPVAPGIVHVCIAGVRSESLLFLLDRAGIAASSASSCASGAMASSHVLEAMGVDPALADGSLRLSLGWSSTDDDVDAVLAALPPAVAQLRATQAVHR
jgi:cysteine desulfurase